MSKWAERPQEDSCDTLCPLSISFLPSLPKTTLDNASLLDSPTVRVKHQQDAMPSAPKWQLDRTLGTEEAIVSEGNVRCQLAAP